MKEFPPFRLDTVNQCLWRLRGTEDAERISLTPKAFSLLGYLVEHPGRLVTHDELLNALWPDTFVQPEVLKSHILDVRSALGDHPKNPQFIETLPKRGYQFVAPVRDASTTTDLIVQPPSRKLVGRNTQMGDLHNCLQRALTSQRQVVFVTGEPGIGKTSLVDEFAKRAASDFPALRFARGQCVEGYGGKEAYYPVLEALSQLCASSGGEAVVQIMSAQAPTWLVQFPALVNTKQREILQREILGATRERMLREIGEALETIAVEKPLLLVLEDLHWADPSTVDLVSSLARRRAMGKLMLIGTYRPVDVTLARHPLKAVKQDLLVHHLCHEIALEPLGEAEVAEYLVVESGGAAVPDGLAGLIYRHTEGNPLFMVAALDHMRDRGLIALENGTWGLKAPIQKIDLDAPESLRQMIELQIERLSEDEQRVLEIASVLRKFPLSVALGAAVANVEPDTIEELLEGLARRHQVIRSAGFMNCRNGPSPCYEFVHALYRQVLYRRIRPTRRRKLHESVGENGETLHVMREANVSAELAYQFEEGGDWLRAVKYLLVEAETAGRRFEPKQAAAILEHALDLANKIPEAERAHSETQILQKLSAIYSVAFDPRAVETYEALADRAAHYGMTDMEVRALMEMALPIAHFAGIDRYNLALERAREVLSHSNGADTLDRAAMRLIVKQCRGVGKWEPGDLEQCKNLIAKIREAGDRRLLGEIQFYICYPLFNSSEYLEARRNAEESLAISLEGYEENPYLKWNFQSYGHLVISCHLFLGEWGKALRNIQQRIEAVEKNGDQQSTTMARLERIWMHIYGMDFIGAHELLESMPSLASSMFRRYWLIWAGSVEAGLGNHERALELLLTCRDEMDHHPMITDWYYRMPLQFALTEASLSKGDCEKARGEADQFLKVTLDNEERTFRALAFEVNARVAIAELNLDHAQDFISKALQAMEGYEVPLAHWRVHATAADLHKLGGNGDLANSHREISRVTIMKLADSLPAKESLRRRFLAAPTIRKILDASDKNPRLSTKKA